MAPGLTPRRRARGRHRPRRRQCAPAVGRRNLADPLLRPTHPRRHARLVKGSHIVVPRLLRHDQAYILQNPDRRIFFLFPYERDFTLIGTTDDGLRRRSAADCEPAGEINYSVRRDQRYFREPIAPSVVTCSLCGRAAQLFDDGAQRLRSSRATTLSISTVPRARLGALRLWRQDHDLPQAGRSCARQAGLDTPPRRRLDRERHCRGRIPGRADRGLCRRACAGGGRSSTESERAPDGAHHGTRVDPSSAARTLRRPRLGELRSRTERGRSALSRAQRLGETADDVEVAAARRSGCACLPAATDRPRWNPWTMAPRPSDWAGTRQPRTVRRKVTRNLAPVGARGDRAEWAARGTGRGDVVEVILHRSGHHLLARHRLRSPRRRSASRSGNSRRSIPQPGWVEHDPQGIWTTVA